ncbi:MAG: haloacid dehalogenase [Isosphaeraceae bacterium]|jgi:3-deoxy-D-manno-octulosonate 8-phosphate phosphatase (KDO 8-P phosphatase)|nr:MAG: haloacid dehalogenase [Isosphaeraceae bacterium]
MPGPQSAPHGEPARRAQEITLLVLDVDGVMTDGAILLDDHGVEGRHFYVRDGIAMNLWRRAGHRAAILSGRSAPVVTRRAAELRIHPVLQGVSDKAAAFRTILSQLSVSPEHACFMGDDLVDLPALRLAGLSACPADAVAEVRQAVDLVVDSPGGRGAVRDLVEWILRQQGRFEAAAADYLVNPIRPGES